MLPENFNIALVPRVRAESAEGPLTNEEAAAIGCALFLSLALPRASRTPWELNALLEGNAQRTLHE